MAQPKPEGPTDEELLRLAREWNSGFESIELHFAADYARAVLARWGNPTPQPVAKGPTIPNAKLHRQELTPLEITLLIEALDFAIGDIKARPNSSNHVAVRAKLKRSISHPRGHQ